MVFKIAVFAAVAALQLAAVPAMAQSEGNGPGGPVGGFEGWVVPASMSGAAASGAGSELYTQSPSFTETFTSEIADVGIGNRYTWPAQPLRADDSRTYARVSGPRAPRG